jgi:hypothetical protein
MIGVEVTIGNFQSRYSARRSNCKVSESDDRYGIPEETPPTRPKPVPPSLPGIQRQEQELGQWLTQIEGDERPKMEPPTQRRTRERQREIEDKTHYSRQDGRFEEIVQTVERLQEGPQRRKALRRFWNDVYEDQLVQAQEDLWPLRYGTEGTLRSSPASLFIYLSLRRHLHGRAEPCMYYPST